MDDDKNLDKNLDIFTKLVSDLASLDDELSEEDQAVILLNRITRRFEPLVHTLKYGRDQDTISLMDITRAAYSIELDMKAKGSKGKQGSRSKSKTKGKRTCRVCGAEGHFKKDFPKRNQHRNMVKAEASIGKSSK